MAAIYMWPPKPGTTILLTTNLYQVYMSEGMEFATSLSGGALSALPSEQLYSSVILPSGYWYQARWFYTDGPYEDQVYSSVDHQGGYWYQARWFYVDGPYEDELYSSVDHMGGYFTNVLVEADSPDEMLQLDCVINTSCSMTGI